jgi:hypothetical protein
MGRSHGHKTRDKNKATLPQVPKNMKSDGIDVKRKHEQTLLISVLELIENNLSF